ncbi:PspA/IM30 family protein [Aureispira anguillae]|uniref:PspA/IM30 family protein n=1 Tax=Aureispira anguillae TaxID=2864201 RepID=A0A915YJI0_9BACT|nr:PspA/IM30 family protein [Aureispira anguillae]BDS14137.1 PspA/IM30 family protein [Aureispira anguillae]
MWSFVKRLWNILVGNLHEVADKFEQPITMTKQGIRDLEAQLKESLQSFAEVRAVAIRSKNEVNQAAQAAEDYKKKAMTLLHKAQKGQNSAEFERLAAEAMAQREQKLDLYKTHLATQQKYEKMVATMNGKIKRLKREISKWKSELKSLESRQKAAAAGMKISKVMAGVDSGKTLEMLNKMKERVENDEALAEAYGEMATTTKSIDEEINAALEGHEGMDALLALKEEMGLLKKDVIDLKPEEDIISIEIERNNDLDAI